MQRLEPFSLIAYDTNCLVYYCFWVEIPESSPKVTVTARQTAVARTLTDALKAKGKQITTYQDAYEELKECIYSAVVNRMSDREVEAMLGCPQGVKVKDQLVLHVQLTVEKKVRQLERKAWFTVDTSFSPDQKALQALDAFFASQSAGLGKSAPPGDIDKGLVVFGQAKQIPLVTNDRGISNFSEKLQERGLAFQIYYLMSLQAQTP